MKHVTYVADRNDDGTVDMLYRFCRDEEGFSSEYLDDGKWIRDNTLISVLNNLHNSYYKEITEEEAMKIAPMFGGTIEAA